MYRGCIGGVTSPASSRSGSVISYPMLVRLLNPVLYRRKLNLKAKVESGLSYFSVKGFAPGAFNVDSIGQPAPPCRVDDEKVHVERRRCVRPCQHYRLGGQVPITGGVSFPLRGGSRSHYGGIWFPSEGSGAQYRWFRSSIQGGYRCPLQGVQVPITGGRGSSQGGQVPITGGTIACHRGHRFPIQGGQVPITGVTGAH